MNLDVSTFTPAERSTLQLRLLYEKAGYRKYRMARFEEYSLYQQYESFLPDAQVVTFTDLDGKLRAIRPDVTLSIAKNAQPAPGSCKKYFYTEQVCRPSRESHVFTEISQMGLECLGAVGGAEQAEVGPPGGAQPQRPFRQQCAGTGSHGLCHRMAGRRGGGKDRPSRPHRHAAAEKPPRPARRSQSCRPARRRRKGADGLSGTAWAAVRHPLRRPQVLPL